MTEDEWTRQQDEKRRRDFFEKNWSRSCAPARAVARIESGEFAGAEWQKANSKLNRLLSDHRGAFLALVGSRGPGKTQLGVCAMHRVCQQGKPVRYVKALDFFAEVKAAYLPDSKDDERGVIKRFCRPQLLVIDGMEVRGETPWEDRMLSHLIDRRYDDMTDTILIANLKEEDLLHSIGSSAESRLREVGGVIICDWPSFRT